MLTGTAIKSAPLICGAVLAAVAAEPVFGDLIPYAIPPWFTKIPVNGGAVTINNPAQVTVVGGNTGGGLSWTGLNVQHDCGPPSPFPCVLNFTLISYTSGDTDGYDQPSLKINGVLWALYNNGTIAQTIGNPAQPGEIGNSIQGTFNLKYTITLGPSTVYDIGLGVYSVDGIFGAGTAVFGPVSIGKLPAPGALGLLGVGGLLGSRSRRRR